MNVEKHNFAVNKGSGWVQLTPSRPNLPSLVCFHFAGGSAQSFQGWVSAFDGVANLFAYELPGRGRRHGEPFVGNLQAAAQQIVDGWIVDIGSRFVLCGHSLGALLAYETTLELERRSLNLPSHLVLLARQAPQVVSSKSSLPEPSLEGLRRYLGKLNGTPAAVLNDDSFMELMIPVLRADFELLRTYQPRVPTPLQCPLQVIGAAQDEIIDPASLLPWIDVAGQGYSISLVEGGHFSPMTLPSSIRDACFLNSSPEINTNRPAVSLNPQRTQGVQS